MHCVEFVFVSFPCFVSSYFYLCSESCNLFEIFLHVVLVSIVSSFSPPGYVSLKMNLFTSFCENLRMIVLQQRSARTVILNVCYKGVVKR